MRSRSAICGRGSTAFSPLGERRVAALARTDADGVEDLGDEDLAVADLARAGGLDDRIEGGVEILIADDDLDAHLREEVDGVGGAAVEVGAAHLATVAPHSLAAQAPDIGGFEGILNRLQTIHPDERLDSLHRKEDTWDKVLGDKGQGTKVDDGFVPSLPVPCPFTPFLMPLPRLTVLLFALAALFGGAGAILALRFGEENATLGVFAALAFVGAGIVAGRGESDAAGVLRARTREAAALQARVEQQRRTVDALAEGLDSALFICDRSGRILYANPPARRLFGNESPAGMGLLAATRNEELEGLLSGTTGGGVRRAEIAFSYPQEWIGLAQTWEEPTERRVFVSVYEITELRRLERMRRDFVANVSHELRTPMTIIRGYAETLLDESPPTAETSGRMLPRIMAEIDRLASLVGDLLTLSVSESGTARKEPCDLAEVVLSVVERLEAKAREKGLVLEYEGPEELWTAANPAQIGQVALNLVDNALNYTAQGSVTVGLRAEENRAVLTVRVYGVRDRPAARRAGLRTVLSGGSRAESGDGGNGLGPQYRAAYRGGARRHGGGGEHGGRGFDVPDGVAVGVGDVASGRWPPPWGRVGWGWVPIPTRCLVSLINDADKDIPLSIRCDRRFPLTPSPSFPEGEEGSLLVSGEEGRGGEIARAVDGGDRDDSLELVLADPVDGRGQNMGMDLPVILASRRPHRAAGSLGSASFHAQPVIPSVKRSAVGAAGGTASSQGEAGGRASST